MTIRINPQVCSTTENLDKFFEEKSESKIITEVASKAINLSTIPWCVQEGWVEPKTSNPEELTNEWYRALPSSIDKMPKEPKTPEALEKERIQKECDEFCSRVTSYVDQINERQAKFERYLFLKKRIKTTNGTEKTAIKKELASLKKELNRVLRLVYNTETGRIALVKEKYLFYSKDLGTSPAELKAGQIIIEKFIQYQKAGIDRFTDSNKNSVALTALIDTFYEHGRGKEIIDQLDVKEKEALEKEAAEEGRNPAKPQGKEELKKAYQALSQTSADVTKAVTCTLSSLKKFNESKKISQLIENLSKRQEAQILAYRKGRNGNEANPQPMITEIIDNHESIIAGYNETKNILSREQRSLDRDIKTISEIDPQATVIGFYKDKKKVLSSKQEALDQFIKEENQSMDASINSFLKSVGYESFTGADLSVKKRFIEDLLNNPRAIFIYNSTTSCYFILNTQPQADQESLKEHVTIYDNKLEASEQNLKMRMDGYNQVIETATLEMYLDEKHVSNIVAKTARFTNAWNGEDVILTSTLKQLKKMSSYYLTKENIEPTEEFEAEFEKEFIPVSTKDSSGETILVRTNVDGAVELLERYLVPLSYRDKQKADLELQEENTSAHLFRQTVE